MSAIAPNSFATAAVLAFPKPAQRFAGAKWTLVEGMPRIIFSIFARRTFATAFALFTALAGSAIAEYICELTIIMVVAFRIICIICITTTEPPKDTLKFQWLSRCHQRRNAENDQNAVEMVHRSC